MKYLDYKKKARMGDILFLYPKDGDGEVPDRCDEKVMAICASIEDTYRGEMPRFRIVEKRSNSKHDYIDSFSGITIYFDWEENTKVEVVGNVLDIKNSNKITMNKLTTTLKRVLSEGMQAQYKAGLRNGDLELTERGKQELMEILAVENEDKLTEVANEIIKDETEG